MQPSIRFLVNAIALCALAGAGDKASSQTSADYPTRPVRIVVVYAPGGGLDVVTRIVADPLTRRLGRQVVVENRPGAAGNIGTEYVSKATADGYTLMVTTNSHHINAFIYRNPGYDARKDFAPVIQLTGAPSVIVTQPRSPLRSVQELVNTARAQPGKLSYGTAGNGSPTHVAAEMFRNAAGIDLAHVPYKSAAQSHLDVIGGQIPLAMAALPAVMSHIQSGTLRAMAVTTVKRWAGLPDVPTIAESGYAGYSHVTWIAVFVPAATPRNIIERVNREIAGILKTRDVHERLMAIGAEPVGGSVADFAAMLKADYESVGKLVSRIGLKVD
jgi:tripartite-type tricarboxylate transporter receptor subunit TctC